MAAGKNAIIAEHRRLDLGGRGQAEKDDIGCAGYGGRTRALDGATCHEIVDRRTVAVAENGERIALLADVLRRAVAHQADADIADTLHSLPSSRDLVLATNGGMAGAALTSREARAS